MPKLVSAIAHYGDGNQEADGTGQRSAGCVWETAEEQEEAGQEVVEEQNCESYDWMDTAAAGQAQDIASVAYDQADLLVAIKAASGIQRRSVDAGTRQPAAGVEPSWMLSLFVRSISEN